VRQRSAGVGGAVFALRSIHLVGFWARATRCLSRHGDALRMSAQVIAADKTSEVEAILGAAAAAENLNKLVVVRNLARRLCSGDYNSVRTPPSKFPEGITVREFAALPSRLITIRGSTSFAGRAGIRQPAATRWGELQNARSAEQSSVRAARRAG
jgi:hypothetical protein